MFQCFILGSSKFDGKIQKNPGRYSMIDERKWKDSEKNFDNIQGSLKDDEKMMIRFKSNCKDRQKKMER
jgi:hypothetical protein